MVLLAVVYLVAFALLGAIALGVSPPFRAWLRGTGSIRQTLSNAGVGLVFLASQLLLRGVVLALFAWVAGVVPWKLPDSPWSFVLAFVLLDLVYYVQHRLEHAVPLLWAIHAVHHQSNDYNLSVSFRVGALASIPTALFHLALAVAGVSPRQYAGVAIVHAMLLFALHARSTLAFGPGRIFNAPVYHRVHHGADAEYIDKNFGGVFLLFDRLGGTFAPYTKEPSFGVTGERSPTLPLTANVAPWAKLAARVRSRPTPRAKLRAVFFHD